MKVAAIVSHLNSARTLDRCLSALEAQTRACEIIVVDGGSNDGSLGIAKGHDVILLERPGCSEAEGQNIGISSIDADVFCMTNSDCYVPPDWAERHAMWHVRGYDMVGGKLFWGGDEYAFSWSYMTPRGPSNLLTSGLSLGFSNCSFTRQMYDDIGGIRDMKAQQDMDFWLRANIAGARVALDPQIQVYHDHPFLSLNGAAMRCYHYARNHVILLRKYHGRTNWPSYAKYPYNVQLLSDTWLIRSTQIWKQQKAEGERHGISTSLLKFLFLRALDFRVPSTLGWLSGMLYPIGKVEKDDLGDAHLWGR